MTEQYREEQLATARAESAKAREVFNTAKSRKIRLAAAEDLEFWSNKTAFLEHAR